MTVNFDHTCPITRQVMVNPKKLEPCGHVFEGTAIESWTRIKNVCPLDQREIVSMNPQNELRAEIHQFIASNTALFEGKTAEELQQEIEETYGLDQTTVNNARTQIELEARVENAQNPQFEFLRDRVDLGALFIRNVIKHVPGTGSVRFREFSGPRAEAFLQQFANGGFVFRISENGNHFEIDWTRPQPPQGFPVRRILLGAVALTSIASAIYFNT